MPDTDNLEALKKQATACRACRLASTRTSVVFGEGNPNAQIMIIGEGPGKQEDLSGRPFVGRAGELLTRIIEEDMGLSRSDIYIANIVKCRPTIDLKMGRDRPPEKDEVEACTHFLEKQIEIIRPKVIITLGNPATKFILGTKTGITKIHGTWGSYNEIAVMPTYHPSYLIRNGGEKSPLRKDVSKDIKKVLKYIKK